MQEKIRTMKKIHVLPTDKPSRIYMNLGQLFLEKEYSTSKGESLNHNIYITSDEEIKREDWYYHLERKTINNTLEKADYFVNNTKYDKFKKIILTTDQDLIAEGIQQIDDEFLEWFVKNPSCERIEVNGISDVALGGFADVCYKIIIPKEEPKNICIQTGLPCGMQCLSEETCNSIRLKQETLEEASREYYKRGQLGFEKAADTEMAFLRGAKWQQERMYSIIDEYVNDVMGGCNLRFEEWFEQFKNK